jgi:regulator of replication initiation timing
MTETQRQLRRLREQHGALTRENARLTIELRDERDKSQRLRARNLELANVNDNLRVERDAADALLGNAMDQLLGRDRPQTGRP